MDQVVKLHRKKTSLFQPLNVQYDQTIDPILKTTFNKST